MYKRKQKNPTVTNKHGRINLFLIILGSYCKKQTMKLTMKKSNKTDKYSNDDLNN